ncbi:MAG: hypothetical protein DCC68_25985 [Planctomycetota bacterium]|nr:MAG: hypothetical protein DCC68_25985 [Planctomycetota bacterium]
MARKIKYRVGKKRKTPARAAFHWFSILTPRWYIRFAECFLTPPSYNAHMAENEQDHYRRTRSLLVAGGSAAMLALALIVAWIKWKFGF